MPEWKVVEEDFDYETYCDTQLGKGICPDSGEPMESVMDWWNRRVLMCEVCDCFGYPLVMSDYDPEAPLPPMGDDSFVDNPELGAFFDKDGNFIFDEELTDPDG